MFITAYYFRAHAYTIVPKQVREDMEWMAACGTDAISIGILEQDLYAAVENFQLVCAEANRVGMKVFATPSRWGLLVAGCPKVPSIFNATNPDALTQNADGSPLIDWLGPVASVHHSKTFDFYCESMAKMFDRFPIDGVIWDEVKNLEQRDYSPAAREALAGKDLEDIEVHQDATADFFDEVGKAALEMKKDLRLSMFLYGHYRGHMVETLAAIEHLDDIGCDGRPYSKAHGGVSDSGRDVGKALLDDGPYFIEIARKNGKGGLLLIENHAMTHADIDLMEEHLQEVIELNPEHLLYYYYPRSVEDPDRAMDVLAKQLTVIEK